MENKQQKQPQKLRVLVGDDQIGEIGSFSQRCFLRNYGNIARFNFADKANNFIQQAKEGKYDALLIDLNWEDADWERTYKTGFRVLDAVKMYAPIRILHTSDKELMERGYLHGATHCIEKNKPAEHLEKILRGDKA